MDVGANGDRRNVSLSFVSVKHALLTVIRKAAVGSGHRVRARNVVYLDVASGRELICRGNLTHLNRTFQAQAREIAAVWPKMKQQ
jgi:hypothetical protein